MEGQKQSQLVCPNCKGGNPPNAAQCQWCGYLLQPVGQGQQPGYPPQGQAYAQQPVYVQVPQPVVVQKRSNAPIIIGGCLVLVVLACAGVFGLSLLGSNVNRTTNGAVSMSNGKTPGKVAGVGDTVNVGSWTVRVEKTEAIKEFDWSGFGNMQTAKGLYLLVYIDAQNATSKPDSINSFDYKVTDSSGAHYDTCSEFGCYSYPNQVHRDNFNSDVPPRTHTPLLAIFDVAPDAKGLVLRIENSADIALGELPTPGPVK